MHASGIDAERTHPDNCTASTWGVVPPSLPRTTRYFELESVVEEGNKGDPAKGQGYTVQQHTASPDTPPEKELEEGRQLS